MLELLVDVRQWTNKETGEIKEYNVYYVLVHDIKVELKPVDRTGAQLIESALK